MKMAIISGISETAKNLFLAVQDVWRSYEYAKKHRFSTVFWFQDGEIHEFKASIKPDNKWVTPKEINHEKAIVKSYRRFPQGDTVFLCTPECPHTIDVSTWDIKIDDIKRGSVLSSIAYDLFRMSIFKYMTAQSKKEMVLLIMVFSLFSLAIGIIIGGSFVG